MLSMASLREILMSLLKLLKVQLGWGSDSVLFLMSFMASA